MEENKLDKLIEQQDKLIEQQDEIIKILKASNKQQYIEEETEETNEDVTENKYSVKGGDHPIERILQAVTYGFEQDEKRNDRMKSLIGTLKWYMDNNLCREDTVIDFVSLVSEQSKPPFQPEKVLSIWESIMHD